ncbi:hypothetical protein SHKM778_53030 [Streptomyces sp. KM77-8]|uniref:PE family protein n=1 Tax=Streptomyces haneummycinicus TaxID=3074435 RepID=A0AAT9HN88_9ACTN
MGGETFFQPVTTALEAVGASLGEAGGGDAGAGAGRQAGGDVGAGGQGAVEESGVNGTH